MLDRLTALQVKYPVGTKGKILLDSFAADFFCRRGWAPETIAVVEYSAIAASGYEYLMLRWGPSGGQSALFKPEHFQAMEGDRDGEV